MILVYSVALTAPAVPIAGINSLQQDGLHCFYSAHETSSEPAHVQQDAVRFFNVNREVFARVDLIAFRFPTLLQNEDELRRFLGTHAAQLRSELERLRGKAQVTVYFEAASVSAADSGLDYMRAKAQRAHAREDWEHQVRKITPDLAVEYLAHGDRIHLLVGREQSAALMERLRARFQAAGPFPPSSFAKLLS